MGTATAWPVSVPTVPLSSLEQAPASQQKSDGGLETHAPVPEPPATVPERPLTLKEQLVRKLALAVNCFFPPGFPTSNTTPPDTGSTTPQPPSNTPVYPPPPPVSYWPPPPGDNPIPPPNNPPLTSPEPATLISGIVGFGLMGLYAARRRRQRS
jgi:hypothetical protein